MKKLTLLIGIIFLLASCGDSTYSKAMDQGKLALAGSEFDKALASFELALEEKPKDYEAKNSIENLTTFNEVKKAIEQGQWDDAVSMADFLLKKQNLASSVEKELEAYKEIAMLNKEQHQTVSDKVEAIQALVNEGKYEEARENFDVLKKDESLTSSVLAFSKDMDELSNIIHESIQKQSEAKAIEAEAQAKAAEEKSAKVVAAATTTTTTASKKNEYIQKLNRIEAGLDDINYLYESGSNAELVEAEYEVHKRWDKALNEIYGVLKTQLSKGEMNKLRVKQRQWIKDRDKQAENDQAFYEGGSAGRIQYASTLGQVTKERCYELVDIYMK